MSPEERAALVKNTASQLGFDSCGVTDVSPTPHAAQLTSWLESGMAGTMAYMNRQASRRREPSLIVREATRVVVVTKNYYNADPRYDASKGLIAKYARGKDYHECLRLPLSELASTIERFGDGPYIARAFVDAGPVPERELAQRAGLGWIGKNAMLIDPKAGSFFFIGSIFTDADLAIDLPFEADRCGTCRRCIDACPTNAFPEERVLDSRLCISYLTIEHKGEIEDSLAAQMDNWVFGCDICQDVCPWNQKFAKEADDPVLAQDRDLATVDLLEMSRITDDDFENRYGATALERPQAAGMRRNARIAAANARDTKACLTR